jgi:hypothetical protein
MHAARLVQSEHYRDALATLSAHGAPPVAANLPIYRRVTQEILAHPIVIPIGGGASGGGSGGAGGSEEDDAHKMLRDFLFALVADMRGANGIPASVVKEFEKYGANESERENE